MAEINLNRVEGAIGAVVGRSSVDMFFRKHIKSYLPMKTPEKHYTEVEIEKVYIDFLNDVNNYVGKSLRRARFPNLKTKNLAKYICVIFGKLSWYMIIH